MRRSLVLLVLLAAPVQAATVIFQQGAEGYAGTQDVTLSDQNARWNGGQGNTIRDDQTLSCYRTAGADAYEVRALLRFDELRLPPGARVTAATLTLTFDNWSTGFTVRGYYLKQAWNASAHRLGWRQRDDGHPWAAPGALGPAERAAPAFSLSEFAGRGDETFTVVLDPEVVEGWVRRPATNHGLLLVNEAVDRVTRIYAAEHPDPGRRPRLSVTYEVTGEAPGAPARAVGAKAPPAGTGARVAGRAPGRPRLVLTPPVLGRLRERARAGDRAWLALRARCDGYLPGRIEWPDGDDYPGAGHIGEGYQGSDYFDALLSLGLCHQVSPDGALARRYGEKAAELMVRMSEPEGPHAVDPLRDSGYGIRFFGVGLALGYDWVHGALTAAQRRRVWQALDRWLDVYEQKGFGRQHPQGNYVAGYYAAKLLTGLATRGESPRGEAHWRDWLERVHRGMVQPYYAAHLRGGGWPEGWNYGPLATLHMSWPALVGREAVPGGLDLVRDARAPFLFPIEQGAHLMHFTWPNRRTLDDRGVQYAGDNPAAAQPSLFTVQAGLLRLVGDPLAPLFQRYAREVRSAGSGQVQPWVELLFWDDAAPERDFRTLPLSFLARGMGTVAMRSSWEQDAVWASFTAGPYVNFPDSGEQYFDQGSLAIVRGGRVLLCNAPAALMRHTPGTSDGSGYDDLIYGELFGKGSRRLFNVFYVDRPQPFGQRAATPSEARTRVDLFEDGGAYVLARGDHLEDMYRKGRRQEPFVLGWRRTVLFLRPAQFLVYDETRVADGEPGLRQWLAFHLPARPRLASGRYEVGAGAAFRGALTPLLPVGVSAAVVDLFGRGKVFRLELRPPSEGPAQRWLTLLDAAEAPAALGQATALPADSGAAPGVALAGRGEGQVVLFAPAPGDLRYRAPAHAARHLVVGLAPGRGHAVRVTPARGGHAVHIAESAERAGLRTSAAGVLVFRVGQNGAVLP